LTREGYYSNTWSLIDKKNYSKGIFSYLVNSKNQIFVVEILYNENYPNRPPIVHSSPSIRDPCWDSRGYLHFAVAGRDFAWSIFKKSSNPLIYLIDELAIKYKII